MKQSKDEKVIHLDGTFAFDGDRMCVTLYKKRITKHGKLDFDTIGHYNNLQQMFERIVDHKTNTSRSLNEIIQAIEQLKIDMFYCLIALSQDDQERMIDLMRPPLKHPFIKRPKCPQCRKTDTGRAQWYGDHQLQYWTCWLCGHEFVKEQEKRGE